MKKLILLLCLIQLFNCNNSSKHDKQTITVIVKESKSRDSLKKLIDTSNANLKYFVKPVGKKIKFENYINYHDSQISEFENKLKDSILFKGESVAILNNESVLYTKNITYKHRIFSFERKGHNTVYDGPFYLVKREVINERYYHTEGFGITKNIINIYYLPDLNKDYKTPVYNFTAFGDNVKILDEKGYFLTSSYGCCSSPDYFELYSLNGNKIISSSNLINEVAITNSDETKKPLKYYFSILFNDDTNSSPRIIIKYPDKTKQEIIFETNFLDFFYDFSFNIYNIKKHNKYITEEYRGDEYIFDEAKSIDDIQIIIPIKNRNSNNLVADTIRIPFKNGKPFGKSDKQLLVSIEK